MKEKIIFKLNDQERIEIDLEDSMNEIHCCYFDVIIFFIQGSKRYILNNNAIDSVRVYLQQLKSMLSDALANNLKLPQSLSESSTIQDIGYMYNECRQDRLKKVGNYWEGLTYLLWSGELTAWIYNDEDNNIILKLTPNFPGMPTTQDPDEPFSPEEIANSQAYDTWIKSYKPFLVTKISRETASEWLIEADRILEIIKINVMRMENEEQD